MIKYIKENKNKIIATTTKMIAALIVPGGLIIWGAYELGRFQQRRRDGKFNFQEDSQSSSENVKQ